MVKANKWINEKSLEVRQFCNGDINKFVLLLIKGVSP